MTISSTVIEPMIERRWPAKIRPVSTDIWSWSDRNRWPALMMLSSSLPTLKAMTARTFSAMPCRVTQASATSASHMARVRKRALRKKGSTNVPWPVTTRNGAPPSPRLPPEINIASSGAGTRYPNMVVLLYLADGVAGSASSGSIHAMTSTSRLPRDSMTSTVAPRGSGSSDQARKVSEPPLIRTRTSPGPRIRGLR